MVPIWLVETLQFFLYFLFVFIFSIVWYLSGKLFCFNLTCWDTPIFSLLSFRIYSLYIVVIVDISGERPSIYNQKNCLNSIFQFCVRLFQNFLCKITAESTNLWWEPVAVALIDHISDMEVWTIPIVFMAGNKIFLLRTNSRQDRVFRAGKLLSTDFFHQFKTKWILKTLKATWKSYAAASEPSRNLICHRWKFEVAIKK